MSGVGGGLGQGEEDPSAKPVSDQWLPPFVITDEEGVAVGTIEDGDAVVLFNFRADRMVQISKAFEYENFSVFDRKRFPKVRSRVSSPHCNPGLVRVFVHRCNPGLARVSRTRTSASSTARASPRCC
jgi:BPG-independent PGAM N-terminus (iPGM_N)